MDVEMQLEANGLPLQFGSSTEQPQEPHVADNLAASISNAGATVNSLPTKLPIAESSPQAEQPQAPIDADLVTVPALPPEDPLPNINGTGEVTVEAIEKSITTVPDSQPSSSFDDPISAPAATVSVSDAILTDSFVPSSIPTEIPSSATPIESTQSAMDISQPDLAIAEPPVSDLRTEPHSDALSTEAVAAIETRKHELDNSIDATGAPAIPEVLEKAPSMEGAPPGPATATEQITLTDIGLPSPTQSPPPPPQPSHAELPAGKPVETCVVEPPMPTTSDSIEVAQIAPPEPEPVAVSAPEPVPEPTPVSIPVSLPTEQPPAPAPTPVISRQIELEDQIMTDVPPLPVKQVREREDDTEEQDRAAKRIKTDDELNSKVHESNFKVPEVPAAPSQSPPLANGNGALHEEAVDADDSVTPARLAHMRKVISNLKKSNASTAFRQPVDWMALKIPNYPEIVKTPMDLSTIDHRLKQNTYTSIAAFTSDFEQIVTNCVRFNGPDHGVSQQAKKMQSSFRSQMKNLPPATVEEPTKETKKAAKKQEPTRSAPPRRPSVSTSTPVVTMAASPKTAAPPTPSFAPGPDGIPLIRRDSSLLIDGRPKRAIVPTKRNQDLGSGRPKKKKYELQLKFCDEVLKEISSPKYWQMNQYFLYPVDPVALNIPTYFQIVKKPMDLASVKTSLSNNAYEKAKDFEEDVRLIFKNCYKFNPEGDLVNASGHQLEELFNKKWATKDDWIASREPPSEPHTEGDEDDEDEDDSDDEADNESEDDRNDKIKLLQKQIEMMSKQMGELTQKKSKKSKSPPAKKSKLKTGKKDKQASAAPTAGKDKKEKKKTAPKSKPEKDRYVTFAEKQYISNGIAMLPEKQMQEALKIIQNSVPSLANSDQNEIELDIEEVPNHALLKLLTFVKRYAGPPPDEPKVERAEVYNAPAAAKHKKSKPMNKYEQEAQIEELKGKLGAYAGGTMSPNAMQSIEDGDSSDDDGDSEESEEE